MKHLRSALIVILLAALVGCSERDLQHPSSSMAPTIQPNEVVRVDKSSYRKIGPSRWDVIVFFPPPAANVSPDALFAMRVIGLPGETMEIRGGGIYANGDLQEMPEQIAHLRYLPASAGVSYPFSIPADSYFVVGDNTTNAHDSRFWGAVPKKSIIGKVKNK